MATRIASSFSSNACYCPSSGFSYSTTPIAAGPLLHTSLITRPRPSSLYSSFLPAAIRHYKTSSGLPDRRRRRQRQQQLQSAEKGVVSVRAARMESQEAPLAFRAPDFELPEPLTGKNWKLDDFEDQQGLLVMFICNHCPFVVHLKESLVQFAQDYQEKGLAVVAISSNSVATHPEDGPKYMAEDAKKYGYPFPYLYDETQEVAKAYGAVCTPDFFLFKKVGRKPFEIAYHGRFDETRPRSNAPITGRDLRAAVNAVLSAQPVTRDQKPSIGCSIKWHPGK